MNQTKNYDLIHSIKQLVQSSPLTFVFEHVYGHQDNNTSWESLSLTAKLNVYINSIEKSGVAEARRTNHRLLLFHLTYGLPRVTFRCLKQSTSSLATTISMYVSSLRLQTYRMGKHHHSCQDQLIQ